MVGNLLCELPWVGFVIGCFVILCFWVSVGCSFVLVVWHNFVSGF